MSAVGTWVWVPTTRLARPSHQCASAIFSEVASACTSTMTASRRPAERRRLQRRLDRRERVVERPLHERLPQHLRHEDPPPAGRVEEARPPPRRRPREVQRPEDPRLLLDEGHHVALVEGMVAERHAVGPRLEAAAPHAPRSAPCPPVAFSPLTTTKSSAPLAPEPRQPLGDRRPAAPAHHVAEKEKPHAAHARPESTPCSVTTASSRMSAALSGTSGTSCAA